MSANESRTSKGPDPHYIRQIRNICSRYGVDYRDGQNIIESTKRRMKRKGTRFEYVQMQPVPFLNMESTHSDESSQTESCSLALQAVKRNFEKFAYTYICPLNSNQTLRYIRGDAGRQKFPKLKDKEELDVSSAHIPITFDAQLLGGAEWPRSQHMQGQQG